MVEQRKLFKTKLCVLYQKGHCPRQNCSFAHGRAELRQSLASSYNGRRDHRGVDLRDKLDKRLSPRQRYSPGRDTKDRRTFRGSSPSRSLEKNRSRKRRKKQHFDGQSDFSGSLKSSDGAEDPAKKRKRTSTDSRIVFKEQLSEVQSEIDALHQRKSQLRTLVEEKVEEADILTSRIQELVSQLSKEKEECKRTISKIKKFVKAHKRHARVQEELKRSQVRLQRLGDQLASGTTTGGNEEDSSINIVSDGEAPGYHAFSPQNEVQNNSSPSKKGLHIKSDTAEELKKGNLTNGGKYDTEKIRLGKHSQLNTNLAQLNIDKEVEMLDNENDGHQPLGNESKGKRGTSSADKVPSLSFSFEMLDNENDGHQPLGNESKGKRGTSSADKQKGLGLGLLVPSTSMAAHANDELVDIEAEENIEVVETGSVEIDKGATTLGVKRLPFLLPPPPPVPLRTYSQYKGKDESVDVERLEEMVDVEIV